MSVYTSEPGEDRRDEDWDEPITEPEIFEAEDSAESPEGAV